MMVDINDIALTVQRINTLERAEQNYKQQINEMYTAIQECLMISGNVITKDVDSMYKSIDNLFNKKQAVYVEAQLARKEVLKMVGVQ